jgi:hypothetical protein
MLPIPAASTAFTTNAASMTAIVAHDGRVRGQRPDRLTWQWQGRAIEMAEKAARAQSAAAPGPATPT